MGGIEGLMRKLFRKKKSKKESSVKPEPMVNRPESVFCKDSKAVELANLCKMGDIAAMMDMAYLFRTNCTDSLQKLFDAYERDPVPDNEELLQAHLNRQEREKACAYMTWLVRAALYGNEEAEQTIKHCPYYKKNSCIPYDLFVCQGFAFMKVWASNTLWKLGLIDMVRDYKDCGLDFYKDKGYFDFRYVESYIPPDEDGFGAEWEYDSAFYDEFFCRIPVRTTEKIEDELIILEKKREEFWADPVHNAPERKYRRRLCRERTAT